MSVGAGSPVRIDVRHRGAASTRYQSPRRITSTRTGVDRPRNGSRVSSTRTGGDSVRDLYSRVPNTTRGRSDAATRSADRRNDSLASRYRRPANSDRRRTGANEAPTGRERRSGELRPTTRSPRGDRTRGRETGGARRSDIRAGSLAGDRRGGVSVRETAPGRESAVRVGDRAARGDIVTGSAGHRYATPGRRAAERVGRRAADGRVAALSPVRRRGDSGRRGDPITDAGWRTGDRDYVRGGGDFYGSGSLYYGNVGWQGSYWSLCFGLGYAPVGCNWGVYSYPYYYCSWWPRWYWGYRNRFCFYWNSCYPWYGNCWWWPSYGYRPAAYVSQYYYGDIYYGDPAYAGNYDSGVVVREGEMTPEDEQVSAGPELSMQELAEQHVALGDFYFREERFKEAAESYLRALAYAPEDASIHFVLADALFATGDYHYAAYMIGKALSLDPELALADTDKRTFYANAELFDTQLETLKKYVEDKPYDAAAYLVLGYNLKFSKQPEEAAAAFRRVLEIEPDRDAAKLFLEAIENPPEPPAAAPEATKPVPEKKD